LKGVDPSGQSTITCSASDPDGDSLTYSWDAEDGTIPDGRAAVTLTAPLAAEVFAEDLDEPEEIEHLPVGIQ
jgi:hypothetical protein